MSIVITVIDHECRGVYMASDNRSVDLDGNFASDENTKVHKIREGIIYSSSGLVIEAEKLLTILQRNKDLKASELIKIASEFKSDVIDHNGKEIGTTFILAGVYDDGQPFMWDRSTNTLKEDEQPEKQVTGLKTIGANNLVIGQSCFIVSAPTEATLEKIRSNFINFLKSAGGNYALAIDLAIKYASRCDPKISASNDLIAIDVLINRMYTTHLN